MKVFVTGGTGFLGRAVVPRLVAAGHDVTLLARPGTSRPEGGLRVFEGDVTDPDAVAMGSRGADAIVHMAALVSTWQRDPEAFTRVNVQGLKNVVHAAYTGGIRRVLYTSSILALGPTAPGGEGDEDREPAAIPGNRYIESKAEALAAAREAAGLGCPLVTLYPGIVYGPGPARESGVMTRLLSDLLRGRLPAIVGPGDRRWCHAAVDDVAAGHVMALERGEPGRGYVLGGPNATLREWLETAASLAGVRPPRWGIPFSVSKILGGAELAVARLTGRTPLLTPDVVEVFRNEWAYSSARAERELGYTITPLGEGLARTLAWLKSA